MTGAERVSRALRGEDLDRPPFTFWHHFHLEQHPGERLAEATLAFHRTWRTDLVKVMNDYPYPRPLRIEPNPFPEQLRALDIIREALNGRTWFVDTLFNPYNRARKTFGLPELLRMQQEEPQKLLDALEVIARSEANHARHALAAGAAGIFLAIEMCDDYTRFGEPFDKMVLEAAADAPMNILHLHGDHIDWSRFATGWPAAAINYSIATTRIAPADARRQYEGVLMCGIDEVNFRMLTEEDLRVQWQTTQQAAGRKFLLAPGCSVPDDCAPEELARLPQVLGA